MFFLLSNITNHILQLRTRIGKCAESLLPIESSFHKTFLIDPTARVCLNFLRQFGHIRIRFRPDQNMHMIGNTSDCDQLLAVICDNSGDVTVKFLSPIWQDEVLAAAHREYYLNVDLGICVGYSGMPFLRNSVELFRHFYKHYAPTELIQLRFADCFRLPLSKLTQLFPQFRPGIGEDGDREQSGVFSSRLANR